MPIEVLHLDSLNRCDEVFALYRSDSGTLGFMPKGAFEEGILNRRLLVAKDEVGRLLGYLLYRLVGRRASIAHLCVAKDTRGKGVASHLVSALKEHTSDLDGITLKCRNDFEAHRFWPKLGFVAKGTAVGRGAHRAELTVWHIDHGHPDLFSVEPSKTRVVIDANVFFDLWVPERPKRDVSAALTEPWVEDIVELALTPEIYNDIQRAVSSTDRGRSKAMVTTFEQVRAPALEVDRIVPALRVLYPTSVLLNQRDESDIRHLAFTIAAGAKYFVTRDEGVLDKAPEVLQRFDVHVFSPTELVSHLDWVAREQEYQPLRLEASSVTAKRAEARQLDSLAAAFRLLSERMIEFRSELELNLANPKGCEIRVSSTRDGTPLALLGLKRHHDFEMILSFVRQAEGKLSGTVVRHMLMGVIREAAASGMKLLRVSEKGVTTAVAAALEEVGFKSVGRSWIKPVLSGFVNCQEIERQLDLSIIGTPVLVAQASVDEIETFVWPAKLSDDSIPCYLIPIRAEWAEHFFDTQLAELRLPGISDIRDELHLGVEAIYYSSSRVSMTAPGRILWYVSQGNEKMGSMQVKACSRLREVVRAGPKALFKRFRRLGVYAWTDLYELAGKSIGKELVALRFSHTERFHRPVDVKTLTALRVPPPYPGPRPIPYSSFVAIYNQANSANP